MENTTLFHRSFPARSVALDAGVVFAGAGIMAFSAQVQAPLAPVPITLQTLALMVISAVLGAKRGALTQAAYLLTGLCGAPVFAGFKAGPAALIGPTGGYLLAFIPAAFLIGMLAQKGWDKSFFKSAVMMLLGSLVIWLLGSLHLSLFVGGLSQAMTLGVLPFLPGDAIKIALAAGCLPGLWTLLQPYLPKQD